MIKEAICEGSDVEEALLNAKRELGVTDTDDYDFGTISTFLDTIDSKDSIELEAIIYDFNSI